MMPNRRLLFFCSLFLFSYGPWSTGILGIPSSQLPLERNPSLLIRAKNGAVASVNKRCSDIGIQVLREGGNAVDAAIAATFCTGVVNMFS